MPKENGWFASFVLRYLTFTGKCFRHCEKPTSMSLISQTSNQLVGAYNCPAGVVSQVVYFSLKPDLDWFRNLLEVQVGADNISAQDIRVASRHGWELGGNAIRILRQQLDKGASVCQVYWTRYPKTEEQKQLVLFLCRGDDQKRGCMKLFLQDRNAVERLCSECRKNEGAVSRSQKLGNLSNLVPSGSPESGNPNFSSVQIIAE